jgi:glycosyltransferase involved in cell wall biosynthesis
MVSDQGGPRDLVTEGVDGCITRGGDLAELVAVLRPLCTDPARRQSMGAAARKKVEDRSWPHAARKFWAITA